MYANELWAFDNNGMLKNKLRNPVVGIMNKRR